ncbi:MAG: response regulator [Candidatus Thiodiazotropha sp. (ex Lucina aurantia)]|uniref:Response regulator rcp1 n=2 Tax=Candidatus Thiodiazotropha TaxID=1913444 RepID=A0A7Z0VPH0_9GAMM|nr:response regulator [Candidatus Thiodiazotropha endolucinida]MBT3012425.1 response regulator [Candidatus Thiodiazotropha sp. (ex Lucina pensylvanica)]MBT3017938.1 response regulator [Candidatus Thiodiazotropha taylori]MBT3038855.1 response regulator [Candidatus Thiodiazotropha sp. (ex Codakia orbicularis)]MBV2102819.1 response regulator [Candidatus Thiodiazotropha sp. (ex Lucina aurantia)]MBT3022851.1 response regulator [Candidatus Thiodiazotropha taylori]
MLNKDETILLIEDDRVDIMTVQRALQKNNISNPLLIARTGLEALDMLRGTNDVKKINPLPALTLLDLNLPKMSGFEFLQELRNDPELDSLRIIVLTSSNEPKDRAAAFEFEVDDYIVKPHSFDEFTRAIATILALWE